MGDKFYNTDILDDSSGIYEISMKRSMPEFTFKIEGGFQEILGLGRGNENSQISIKFQPRKDPNKDIYLIDLNIYRLLNYIGADDNKIRYRQIIKEKIKGKCVTPILYLAEISFYKGMSEGISEYIKSEASQFLSSIKDNSDAKPDMSFSDEQMIIRFLDMLNGDSNSSHNKNVNFLRAFYNDVMYSDEFKLVNNMGKVTSLEKAFNKFLLLDICDVDRIVVFTSLLALFSMNSEEPCFYNLFKWKKSKGIDDQVNNVLGDLRSIRYIFYISSFMPNDACLKFITNDMALFKSIKELSISMETSNDIHTYHFNNIDFERVINKNYKSSLLFNKFENYIKSL